VTACAAHPSYAGRNLEEIARAEGITPVELFSRIIREGGAEVIGHTMTEEDVAIFYRQPWVMVASDGGIANEHPRGAGTFPRVLGRFVREKHLFSLEEAIRKMTSLPAKRVGLADRGTIAPGMKADLVLFDPATVIDRSTFEHPRALAQGIAWVAVNGETVWEAGKATGARPGRVLGGRVEAEQ
jgi:N-acyl-D-aspartate/D-glutamate deacylase